MLVCEAQGTGGTEEISWLLLRCGETVAGITYLAHLHTTTGTRWQLLILASARYQVGDRRGQLSICYETIIFQMNLSLVGAGAGDCVAVYGCYWSWTNTELSCSSQWQQCTGGCSSLDCMSGQDCSILVKILHNEFLSIHPKATMHVKTVTKKKS